MSPVECGFCVRHLFSAKLAPVAIPTDSLHVLAFQALKLTWDDGLAAIPLFGLLLRQSAAGAPTIDTRQFSTFGELDTLLTRRAVAILDAAQAGFVDSEITAAAVTPPEDAGRDVFLIHAALIEELDAARCFVLGTVSRLQPEVFTMLQRQGVSGVNAITPRLFELWKAHAAITRFPHETNVRLDCLNSLYQERLGLVAQRVIGKRASLAPLAAMGGPTPQQIQSDPKTFCVLAEYLQWYQDLALPVAEFISGCSARRLQHPPPPEPLTL